MIRYILYKHKLNNIGDHQLPKIAINSSQTRLHLKRGWLKDAMTWLNYWGIDETTSMQNINNIKNIITSTFKEKMCCKEYLEVKRKLYDIIVKLGVGKYCKRLGLKGFAICASL